MNDAAEKESCTQKLLDLDLFPVFLTEEDIEDYYEGFSNKIIWPLFHYFPHFVNYSEKYWASYLDVNTRFTEAIAVNIKEGDMVWVHDYQLMLVPGMLRQKFPDLSIGFFLHIPFPSYELFRSLPWRKEILDGILGSDMIGFHTFDYMRHFLSAAYRITGHEHKYGRLTIGMRQVKCDALPMGIDYDKFAYCKMSAEPAPEVQAIQESSEKVKLILSVDRLDYSKGIPGRVKAYEKFLQLYPSWHSKVTLIMVVVPSRATVQDYAELKDEIELLCGRINGQFGTFDWVPIRYFYRPFAFESLCALYKYSHVGLVTPLRDGMNLVAKEYVATKEDCKSGALVLSEMAGAAAELDDALLINPCDHTDMANAIYKALEMPAAEQELRMKRMQHLIKTNNVRHWAKQFIDSQMELHAEAQQGQTQRLNADRRAQLVDNWRKANSRLLITDYGGTLKSHTKNPAESYPDEELCQNLKALQEQTGTTVVLTTGRNIKTIHSWFGATGIDLVAEFGACIMRNGELTNTQGVDPDWKQHLLPMLHKVAERTVGSWVEEKEYTLAWHYRTMEKHLGAHRLRDIRKQLIYLTANLNLQVVEGDCVVEIRNAEVSKGRAAKQWIEDRDWDCVIALGNDETDEDTFEAVPQNAWSIKVGRDDTKAKYNVANVSEVRGLLTDLVQLNGSATR